MFSTYLPCILTATDPPTQQRVYFDGHKFVPTRRNAALYDDFNSAQDEAEFLDAALNIEIVVEFAS